MAKVLVVDDDPDFVAIMRTIMKKEGHEVITASNGDQALATARKNRPDIILLDIMMAYVLDGFNVTREIRSDAKLKDIPILVISSLTGVPGIGAQDVDAGPDIDGWISKPVQPAELIQKINALLARQPAN